MLLCKLHSCHDSIPGEADCWASWTTWYRVGSWLGDLSLQRGSARFIWGHVIASNPCDSGWLISHTGPSGCICVATAKGIPACSFLKVRFSSGSIRSGGNVCGHFLLLGLPCARLLQLCTLYLLNSRHHDCVLVVRFLNLGRGGMAWDSCIDSSHMHVHVCGPPDVFLSARFCKWVCPILAFFENGCLHDTIRVHRWVSEIVVTYFPLLGSAGCVKKAAYYDLQLCDVQCECMKTVWVAVQLRSERWLYINLNVHSTCHQNTLTWWWRWYSQMHWNQSESDLVCQTILNHYCHMSAAGCVADKFLGFRTQLTQELNSSLQARFTVCWTHLGCWFPMYCPVVLDGMDW